MIRQRLVAPILAASLLLAVSAGPVAATTDVGVFGCYLGGGERHIAPGDVSFTSGWGALTRGQVVASRQSISWNVTVDGADVDVTPYLSPVTEEDGIWWVRWAYPAGSLAFGEQVTITVDIVLAFPLFDGETHFPAGSVGEFSCTVIADLT